jgi:2-polyprenyl-3-methyl-5-hydroxy-6-metoxy-1,4-benzoquinol methylase
VYDQPAAFGTFDVVIFCMVLEHLADPTKAVASAAQHAADRSVLKVRIPFPEQKSPIAWFLGATDRPAHDAVSGRTRCKCIERS